MLGIHSAIVDWTGLVLRPEGHTARSGTAFADFPSILARAAVEAAWGGKPGVDFML